MPKIGHQIAIGTDITGPGIRLGYLKGVDIITNLNIIFIKIGIPQRDNYHHISK